MVTPWDASFEDFLADVGKRPSPKHTLDRIDNDGNYEQSNVRWATAVEQGLNRRTNRLLTHNGKTQTLGEWATAAGLSKQTIRQRIIAGWSVSDAVTQPCSSRPLSKRQPLKAS